MRKIIVFNHITLDGFFAGPNGELDWPRKSDGEMEEVAAQGRDAIDTYLFGRVTYEMMASYWPTPQAREQSPVFADALNRQNKIVFSSTLPRADWAGTRLVKHIDREVILGWKEQAGGNMLILGSGSIVRQLADLDLIDEYQLVVNPVALGQGRSMFDGLERRLQLLLAESRAFRNGTVLLTYRPG